MRKEVGYCDYHNREFVEKYNGLTYCEYVTRIEGNTFYLEHDRTKSAGFDRDYSLVERIIIKHSNQRNDVLCIIPMIKTAEETIRDILRSWNFGCKYEWLNDDLEG